jgi:hypothetical protein
MSKATREYLIRRALKRGRSVSGDILVVRPSAYGARRYHLRPLSEWAVYGDFSGIRVRRWYGRKTWREATCDPRGFGLGC